MTAPVWQTADQKTATGTTSPATVNKPDNLAVGDLIVLALAMQGSGTSPFVGSGDVTVPSGFTLHFEGAAQTSRPRAIFATKVAGGSEPSTYSISWTGNSSRWKIVAGRVSGWDTASTIVKAGANTDGTLVGSLDVTGQTTSVADVLRLAMFVWRSDAGTVAISTSGFTDFFNDTTGSGALTVAGHQALASAGAQGDVTGTFSSTARVAGNTLYIEPAAAAGQTVTPTPLVVGLALLAPTVIAPGSEPPLGTPVWHADDQKTNSGAAGASASVDRPDNVSEGDLIVLVLNHRGGSNPASTANITPPSGFTMHFGGNSGGSNQPHAIIFVKAATGSEPASYTITTTAAFGTWHLAAGRVTGWDGTPVAATNHSSTSLVSSLTVSGLTTTVPNVLRIASFVGRDAGAVTITTGGFTDIASHAVAGHGSTSGRDVVESAGTAGDVTASHGGTVRMAGTVLYIEPAPVTEVTVAPSTVKLGLRLVSPSLVVRVSPAVLGFGLELPAPSVGDLTRALITWAELSVAPTIEPEPLALGLRLLVPTVSVDKALTPDPLVLGLRLRTPTIIAPLRVSPNALTLGFELQAPTVVAAVPRVVTPAALTLGLRLLAPTLIYDVRLTPDPVALAFRLRALTLITPQPPIGALPLDRFAVPTLPMQRGDVEEDLSTAMRALETLNQLVGRMAMGQPIFVSASDVNIAAGSTVFISMSGGIDVLEGAVTSLAPQQLVFSGLHVRVTPAPGPGESYTITLRVNSFNTTVAVTISGDGREAANIDGGVLAEAGDRINFKLETSGGAATLTHARISLVAGLNTIL